MFVCCECCVLSGRGLCDELITRPEEFYWLWYVIVCNLETSRMRRPWPALGRAAPQKKKSFSLPCTWVQFLVDLLLFSTFSKTTPIWDFNVILLFNFQII